MEELKKELEILLAKYIEFEDEVDENGGDVALYDYALERFEDVVGCLYDLVDSLDKNKFRCSSCYDYRSIEEKDSRIIDEDGEGVCIYCADECIMNAEIEAAEEEMQKK